MSDDVDPFSDLFPPFFNPPTIVVSLPDVLSSILGGAGLPFSHSSTEPPQTTPAPPPSSSSTPPQTTPQSSRPPIRTPMDAAPPSTTHSATSISMPSSTPTPAPSIDATTVLFNVTNILTETSLLTAPGSPAPSSASASAGVRTLPRGTIVGIVAALVSSVAVLWLALLLLYRRRRARRRRERAVPHPSSPLLFRCAGAQSPQPAAPREKTPTRGQSDRESSARVWTVVIVHDTDCHYQEACPASGQTAPTADTSSSARVTMMTMTRPRESVVDMSMSYISDDHLPLMTAGPSSPRSPTSPRT